MKECIELNILESPRNSLPIVDGTHGSLRVDKGYCGRRERINIRAAVHANIDRPKLRESPATLGNSLEISTKHT